MTSLLRHWLVLGFVVVATSVIAKPTRVALYASVGAEFTQYDVNVDNATLTKRASVTLPANVQYAWPHPSKPILYVAWSNGGPVGAGSAPPPSGNQHGVTAFRIDPASGALHPLGQPVALLARPIHISVDPAGTHVLIAYNNPSGLTVHRLNPDGTIAEQVKQPAGLDFGIYAHQIRVDPSGQMATLVTRGNGPTAAKPEDPGAIKVFGYHDGVLSNRLSIAPNGGFNFQPRHLDFHPPSPGCSFRWSAKASSRCIENWRTERLIPSRSLPRTASLTPPTFIPRNRPPPFMSIPTDASSIKATAPATPSISKASRFS